MNIIQKPSSNFGSRHGYSPELLVVHIMDGSLAGTDDWFISGSKKMGTPVSSHYGIGFSGEIHQYVQEADEAYSQGNVRKPSAKLLKPGVNPNYYCISIENEGHDISKAPQIQLDTLAELLHNLCIKYNIPADRDHIIGHYEVDSVVKSNCPTPDRSFMDRLVAMVVKLQVNSNKNTMQKYVKFYTTGSDVVKTLNLSSMAFESEGETHAFTSAEDAQERSTEEVVIFWDNTLVGLGKVSA